MNNAIVITNVSRTFGRVRALDELTLSVRQGEIYGFLGRNGAGKTTTLRILMGILRAKSGTIELLGHRVRRVTPAVKQQTGYVSQDQNFYPWMTARQLGRFVGSFYPSWDAAEFERLLTLLDVPDRQRVAELSGGTRTKLGLALALAPRPPLLLLDEPTTGLDPVARREFNDLVSDMVCERGITAFMSSHLVDDVQDIATRVGIIQAGKLSVEGEVSTLRGRVRRVRSPEPIELPAGFTRVREDVWQADVDAWASEPWPEGVVIETLSLDDIFVAFARATPTRRQGA